ncbi:MAG: MFS transporter [Rhodobacteraceae bacterium]|jgi:DHA1 family inner membrane transport protein|uniref:MFS transporter, DHA1 family, arabinose polymer transporter n=1 Tax=Salipiger profundus TaxID=1229727 RepID=A0A1U7D8C0_9RHOB|nr:MULTISPECIES: MFS transporter [Salipiger]APX24373.1 MFS transporter, DHA1 family, arabinose polymer transporter [Salipiger profundus]MAB07324.1 MFS transporter [Paracoccaceae bacterium]GGA19491.1 MFS transporter [Salipiger profundus]SFD36778.1 MFS transporter, DHA1 family, inner membrane transport protein [Salipiger profundus]
MYTHARVRWTIVSLALGAFAIGVSEFAAMGLLPFYAADFGISEAEAGHAVSGYALGVVIGAPVLALIGAKFPKKYMLAGLIAAFGASNLLTAMAPGMSVLNGTRMLSGLPHGAYLGIATLLASDMLPVGRRAAGVAQVMLGLTLANVIGVPAAGYIGEAFGWRACFVLVTVIALFAAALLLWVAPYEAPDRETNPMDALRALKNRAIWLTLGIGAVGFGGIFAVYSYLSSALMDATTAPSWGIAMALSAFGIGASFGNAVAGRLASWSRFGGMLVLLTGMAVVPLLYTQVIGNWQLMGTTILMLGTTAGLVIPLQMRLIDVAGEAQELSAALNHAAFNLANALGPFLAGMTLQAGHGWEATGLVGSALAAGGILVLGIAFADAQRGDRPALAA